MLDFERKGKITTLLGATIYEIDYKIQRIIHEEYEEEYIDYDPSLLDEGDFYTVYLNGVEIYDTRVFCHNETPYMRVCVGDVELTPEKNYDPVEFAKACCIAYASYCLGCTSSPKVFVGDTHSELTQNSYFVNKQAVLNSLIAKPKSSMDFVCEDEEEFY